MTMAILRTVYGSSSVAKHAFVWITIKVLHVVPFRLRPRTRLSTSLWHLLPFGLSRHVFSFLDVSSRCLVSKFNTNEAGCAKVCANEDKGWKIAVLLRSAALGEESKRALFEYHATI
ncbi:hypothetical protein KC19_VG124900 [Ceratodon purpureus]|uniref:Uncharacterized protein n=1 Tax=Ceratodon purpureus TaxID=3225 RepID=A0A8T0HPV8_CERPU|nr:hypothetical protein KC19_VG124900 [Ceratodon purpureus]